MIVQKGEDMDVMRSDEFDEEKAALILQLFKQLVHDCNESPVPNGIIMSMLLKISSIIAIQKDVKKEDYLKMAEMNFDFTASFQGSDEDVKFH